MLVAGALRGKGKALAVLADRMRCIPRALQLIDARHGRQLDAHDLADLAQDVLMVTWTKLREFEGLSTLEGWVWGICVYRYRNALRQRERQRQTPAVLSSRGLVTESSTKDADPLAFEDVHQALERLGADEARVIQLKHFEERTFEEIGELLSISSNTVKARYYRGLEKLRHMLAGGGT